MRKWLQSSRAAVENGESTTSEHLLLEENRYIADILYEMKNAKRRDSQSKLLFKKRMFRETDETITEPTFVNLSFVQVISS